MEFLFELAGRTSLSLLRAEERVAAELRAQMDPYPATEGTAGDSGVVLEAREESVASALRELQNPAGDGTVTASVGQELAVVLDGLTCTIPRPDDQQPRFSYDPGFPVWRLLGTAVRPALQIDMLTRDAVALHSAAVTADGGAVLVAGWSESGKTETALGLMERGAQFLSDKWTILGTDGTAAAFPVGVGIRRWVLRYLPKLKAAVPGRSRAQFAAAASAELVTKPLLRRSARGRVGGLAQQVAGQAISLADRAGLSPSDMREIYGGEDDPVAPVPLRAVAVLVNVPGNEVRVEEADPEWAARRLARSAAYERRPYFALQERRGFAFEQEDLITAEAVIERESDLLCGILGATRVLRVEAPFPTDPGPVATAIEGQL